MADLIEITGVYVHERYRFANDGGDTIIGEITGEDGKPIAIKGPEERDGDKSEPSTHLSYRFYGRWSQYKNKFGQVEKQFHFKTFVRQAPHTRAGVVKYLCRAPNIGPVAACQLFDKFQGDAVRILRESPDVARAAVPRLGELQSIEASDYLKRESALESCMIELTELLDGRGFYRTTAKEALKLWGNRAADFIKADPFRLMGLPGCGFKRCDAMYLSLGGDPAAMRRQALCAWNAVAKQTASVGDTWHYFAVAETGLKRSIGGAQVNFKKALKLAERGRFLASKWTAGKDGPPYFDGDTLWLADRRKAENEQQLAMLVKQALAEPPIVVPSSKAFEGTEVTPHQDEHVATAFGTSNIGILGGSPGTGKTFTIAHYIKSLAGQVGGWRHIAVCAPTGKAAVRMTEAMGNVGVPLRATTVHSLLGVVKSDQSGWSFRYGFGNPLPFRVIVVDEMSITDTDLFNSLMIARANGCMIVLVGDVNQLPPVGHGAPLRDMIAAGVPYGELTKLHRTAGAIAKACAAIKNGEDWTEFVSARPNLAEKLNLVHVPASSPGSQLSQILSIINGAPDLGCHPVWDSQTIVAVNKDTDVSRKAVNTVLQKQVNPNPIVEGTPFRLADKVINTKNRFYPALDRPGITDDEGVVRDEQGRVYVANGDIGYVIEATSTYVDVKLSGPMRYVRVPRGKKGEGEEEAEDATGTGCDWDLAYGVTCHKMQGSEQKIVIIVLDESNGAKRLCDRAWLYTAISRAKVCCYLVGDLNAARGMCRNNTIAKRKTFLKELIGA